MAVLSFFAAVAWASCAAAGGPPPPRPPFAPSVSVKDWGAAGDGVTDDAGAVQRAINNITSGSTLLFPPGVYILSHGLVLMNKRDISLAGVGRATCRPGEMPLCRPAELRMAAHWIKGINPQVPGAPTNRMINIAGSRSVTIRDLVLNGNMNNTQPSHLYFPPPTTTATHPHISLNPACHLFDLTRVDGEIGTMVTASGRPSPPTCPSWA
jgi:hypothetical protein